MNIKRKFRNFWRVLNLRERLILVMCSVLLVSAVGYLVVRGYLNGTEVIPAQGGEYVCGTVGQPRFINPLLSQTNDVDADLVRLTYSSLFKFDAEGKLQNDLVENYEISEDKLAYTLHLKQGVKWHNGNDLTADDVIFTIKTIQDENYLSPLLGNLRSVQAEKVETHIVKLTLKTPYIPFLSNLTFGILPAHLWNKVSANEFALSELNLKPIGSGPYRVEKFKKDKAGRILEMQLTANANYYAGKPHIETFTFKFYNEEQEAIDNFNRKNLKGLNYISPGDLDQIRDLNKQHLQELSLPRYYAIFFNQTKNKALADKNVRVALAQTMDKNRLISEVLKGKATPMDAPIPPQLLGGENGYKTYAFDPAAAVKLLEESGWKDNDGDGVREKGETRLEFSLITPDWSDLAQTAGLLQTMWKEVGIQVNLSVATNIQEENLKSRNYDALLFGEILNYDPDPFAFWHSSQKNDPGLNFAIYDNPTVDKLLEEVRKEPDPNARLQKYHALQNAITEDLPALFLYSPKYLYLQNATVQGVQISNIITPADRFNQVQNWFIKTKRVKKNN